MKRPVQPMDAHPAVGHGPSVARVVRASGSHRWFRSPSQNDSLKHQHALNQPGPAMHRQLCQ